MPKNSYIRHLTLELVNLRFTPPEIQKILQNYTKTITKVTRPKGKPSPKKTPKTA